MRPRPYVWFFAVLALLGAAAVTIPIVYNLRIQLKPEQVAEARHRWQTNGPRDYDWGLLVQAERDGESDEHHVLVRHGRVCWVARRGEALTSTEQRTLLGAGIGPGLAAWTGRGLSEAELQPWSVEGLFDQMEEGLAENVRAGGRNYATASFDARDGHPTHYVRRIKATKERLELTTQLTRPREASWDR
jgi:hypothetical protein